MKTQNEIEDRLWCLYKDRLKLRYRKYLGRHHRNCAFNERIGITDEYFCLNTKIAEYDRLHLCDDKVCAKCQHYRCKFTKGIVKTEFDSDIADPKVCGQKEPKIAVLLWVLHGSGGIGQVVSGSGVSIWRRIWRRFRVFVGFASI